jgi:hypothetical protein
MWQKYQVVSISARNRRSLNTQDTLLLNFKITLKAFSFKLNSSNKSCRAKHLEYNKTGLTIFGFFYKFLAIFKVDSFELRRVLISYRKDPRKIKNMQLGPWPGFTEKPINGDQIPARGLIGGKGKVGQKVQELTGLSVWGGEGGSRR